MASLLKQNMGCFILKSRFRLLTKEKLSQNSVMRSLNKHSHSKRSINGRGAINVGGASLVNSVHKMLLETMYKYTLPLSQ